MGLADDLNQIDPTAAPLRDITDAWVASLDDEDRAAVLAHLRGTAPSAELHRIMQSYGLTAGLTAFKDYRRKVRSD